MSIIRKNLGDTGTDLSPCHPIADNDRIGFRDERFNHVLGIDRLMMNDFLEQLDRDKCLELFDEYLRMAHDTY